MAHIQMDTMGQERPKQILGRALENGRVPHAYLFSGPAGVGKEALAIEFTKALFCSSLEKRPCHVCSSCTRISRFQHPDFIFLFPTSGDKIEEQNQVLQSVAANPYARKQLWASPLISIDAVRQVRKASNLKPSEGRRMVVIAEADKMNIQASNAILKILEEPPASMHLILTTAQPAKLLPTILSRCQEIRLGPLRAQDIETARVEREGLKTGQARLLSLAAQGSYGQALEWKEEGFQEKRETALNILRTCLKSRKAQLDLIQELLQTQDKSQIRKILTWLILWYRDSHIASLLNDSRERIVNADLSDTLEKFNNTFESIDHERSILEIERSIEMLERNIQIQLVLTVLFQRLGKNMKKR